ncbi:SgcJ/EcaC family oxidoreductase [Mesorhizobium sp.]|uniref:YybH family protein n=1 Tax=Mesorhizobium sp. TaxID=1871066 RepID=UPI000FE496B1|nr:SgcJ/EcaC family oxidoreductase [Mesorhizobium sp.]RWP14822.1 MAG: SgcJ/EcaC family oxidoreductase [Mesorhizobium sp.]RWQ49336.1 MAG: SgcJ/EcaC family oxidoreductase [Mesorhizobium sp.]
MTDDESAIRKLVETWMDASRRGDTATVLSLMTDDAILMVPGREPFDKEIFAAAAQEMAGVHVDGTNEIVELQLLGDWAFMRGRIDMTATPPNGKPVRQAGSTLTLLRKEADGEWRLARDANLLTAQG